MVNSAKIHSLKQKSLDVSPWEDSNQWQDDEFVAQHLADDMAHPAFNKPMTLQEVNKRRMELDAQYRGLAKDDLENKEDRIYTEMSSLQARLAVTVPQSNEDLKATLAYLRSRILYEFTLGDTLDDFQRQKLNIIENAIKFLDKTQATQVEPIPLTKDEITMRIKCFNASPESELSFSAIDMESGRINLWNVKSTGNQQFDRMLGNALAMEYITFSKESRVCPLLEHIVKDMPETFTCVEAGFLDAIGSYIQFGDITVAGAFEAKLNLGLLEDGRCLVA